MQGQGLVVRGIYLNCVEGIHLIASIFPLGHWLGRYRGGVVMMGGVRALDNGTCLLVKVVLVPPAVALSG